MKILDVLGLALLVAFAGFVWLPLTLGVAGAGCLLVSRRMVRR